MSYSHHSEQWLPSPVEDVFAFFADPDNLPALMPVWQQARIEEISRCPPPHSVAYSETAPLAAGVGTRLTLSFRPFPMAPFRVRWEAEIEEFVWNKRFCDRQVRGPFAYWNHRHRLRAVDPEGVNATLIVDHIEYEIPFGPLGRLAHSTFLRRQIERTFTFRQQQAAKIFSRLKQKVEQPQA